jgi:hypothetical protein
MARIGIGVFFRQTSYLSAGRLTGLIIFLSGAHRAFPDPLLSQH